MVSRPATGKFKYLTTIASVYSSKKAPTEVFSEINENDEWAAIQKFNTLLHVEEQKQMLAREAARKVLIRE